MLLLMLAPDTQKGHTGRRLPTPGPQNATLNSLLNLNFLMLKEIANTVEPRCTIMLGQGNLWRYIGPGILIGIPVKEAKNCNLMSFEATVQCTL